MAAQEPKDVPEFENIALTWPRPAVAQLALRRAPVNALSLELWGELERALCYMERLFPAHTRALVLCSGLRRAVFTAGNDLRELHAPSTTRRRFLAFWATSARAITRLYTLPLATVAAVHGACPAGGCVLALCCDTRVVTGATTVGLNEAALGIPVPRYWAALFLTRANAHADAERYLLDGVMLPATRARDMGLVDEVVDDATARALDVAEKAAQDRVVALGRAKTKSNMRAVFAREWVRDAPREAREAWADLSKKETVAALGAVLKRLSRPKL